MSISGKLAARISNYEDRRSIGARFRAKRIAPLLRMIEAIFDECGEVEIIDIGGTATYWDIVPAGYLDRHNVRITVVNLPSEGMPRDHGRFKFFGADACDLSDVKDRTFHIAHSNSVIEHVGSWDRMVRFAHELSRVARLYFDQTPNFWFPLEPHCMVPFYHWLPEPVRAWLVLKFQLGHWRRASNVDEAMRTVESAHLLTEAMFSHLFSDGRILTEKIMFLTKSLVAVRDHGVIACDTTGGDQVPALG